MNRIDSSIREHVTVEFFKEDEFVELSICMSEDDEHNESVRNVKLSPADARALAEALNEAADEAESE